MTFSMAMEAMRQLHRIKLPGWKNKYLYMGKTKLPFPYSRHPWNDDAFPETELIIMKTEDNRLIPYIPQFEEINSTKWFTDNEKC